MAAHSYFELRSPHFSGERTEVNQSQSTPRLLIRRFRGRQFLEARIIPQRIEHWIEPEQRRSEQHVRGKGAFVRCLEQDSVATPTPALRPPISPLLLRSCNKRNRPEPLQPDPTVQSPSSRKSRHQKGKVRIPPISSPLGSTTCH